MKIENNFLVDDPRIQPYVPAPRGWTQYIDIKPEFLVLHYTATTNLSDAFCSKYFAPIYIDENGLIYQKVPLNKWAAHAGYSEYGGRVNLNGFSHGIEHVNFGFVYRDHYGRFYRDGKYIPPERVVEIPHRLQVSLKYWVMYTDDLMNSSKDVIDCLYNHYHYVDIVGHEDITEGQSAKVDPGPLYPMDWIKEEIYGPAEDWRFITTRWWPGNDIGAGWTPLKWRPYDWSPTFISCPAGTVVRYKLDEYGLPTFYGRYVCVERDDEKWGWCRSKFLRRIKEA